MITATMQFHSSLDPTMGNKMKLKPKLRPYSQGNRLNS